VEIAVILTEAADVAPRSEELALGEVEGDPRFSLDFDFETRKQKLETS
jgi:hypothetical protein